jgi:hypothetical protein
LNSPFKKEEKGGEGRSKAWWPMECSKLGGQWKVPCLVANGMFQAWWPMEGSMFDGQWNVPSLMANGRFHVWWPMEGERKTHFHLFPLSPQQNLLKPLIFSFDFTVLLYRGSKPLLPPFFPFLRFINYDYALQCNKSFTPSLLI